LRSTGIAAQIVMLRQLLRVPAVIVAMVSLAPAAGAADIVKDCAECPELVVGGSGKAIGQTLVTRKQFEAFAVDTGFSPKEGCLINDGANWSLDAAATWRSPGYEQTDDHPVVCVTWLDAVAYTDWLSEKTGKPYRLPTFAESDAIAHPDKTKYPWGKKAGNICARANLADQSYGKVFVKDTREMVRCDDKYTYTSPVKAFPPTSEGYYDAAGNVWQWTSDCLKGDCSNAVFRGGGWNDPEIKRLEIGNSFADRIVLRNFVIGLRVMREEN
jgi:formylglycine-generating enzyme